jgi:hypothetical protein
MKQTTMVWAKFQSIGHPESTEIYNLPVRDVVVRFARWILSVKMGSRIEVVFGRNESDVNVSGKSPDDMVAMLEELMANESDEVPNEDPPIPCSNCGNTGDVRFCPVNHLWVCTTGCAATNSTNSTNCETCNGVGVPTNNGCVDCGKIDKGVE